MATGRAPGGKHDFTFRCPGLHWSNWGSAIKQRFEKREDTLDTWNAAERGSKKRSAKALKKEHRLAWQKKDRKRLLWFKFGGRVIVESKVELNEERARSLVRWRFDLVNRNVMALFWVDRPDVSSILQESSVCCVSGQGRCGGGEGAGAERPATRSFQFVKERMMATLTWVIMVGWLEGAEFCTYMGSILLPGSFAERLWGVWGVNESTITVIYLVKAAQELWPFNDKRKDLRGIGMRDKFMSAV